MLILDDFMFYEWVMADSDESLSPHGSRPLIPSSRFNGPTSPEALATLSLGFVPKNTLTNNDWALSNFMQWAEWRRKAYPGDPVPVDVLTSVDAVILNKWLSLYIIETRKQDGQRYPTSTLNLLLCGLKRHMKKLNPLVPNFLNEKDPRFTGLRDSIARKLRNDGIGVSVQHAEVISRDEEAHLWSEGVLGVGTPSSLLRAIFFMNGKALCLRGGREDRMLKLSQFSIHSDEYGEFVVYSENGSKNRSGSYKDRADNNKIIKHYADASLGEKCYVYLLKLYFSKLSPTLFGDSSSVFYYRAKEISKYSSNECWFSLQPVGRNTLATMLRSMCNEIGICGKPNHSLRATGATRLFEANVPEKLIQERTGHRSIGALRQYERTSTQQQQAVPSLIASPSGSTSVQQVTPQLGSPLSAQLLPSFMKDCNLSNFTINVNVNN